MEKYYSIHNLVTVKSNVKNDQSKVLNGDETLNENNVTAEIDYGVYVPEESSPEK